MKEVKEYLESSSLEKKSFENVQKFTKNIRINSIIYSDLGSYLHANNSINKKEHRDQKTNIWKSLE